MFAKIHFVVIVREKIENLIDGVQVQNFCWDYIRIMPGRAKILRDGHLTTDLHSCFVIFMFFHFPKEASTDAAHVDGGSCTE